MSETTLAAPDIQLPPSQAELPDDDGILMESPRHKAQMDLLIDALIPWLEEREDGFIGGNMFVYYSLAQLRNKDFKGPDFFKTLKKMHDLWDLFKLSLHQHNHISDR